MTTLHFTADDVVSVAAGANGSVTIELTDAGARRLVTAADRHRAVLQAEEEQRAAWLRSLSDVELLELATARFGGPEPDVVAEAARRMREAAEMLRPALAALPKPSPREVLDELAAARGAELAQAPGIIPQPEHVFPPGRRWSSPVLAFRCPRGCGWAHLVDPVLDDLEEVARPFVIPAGSPDEMSRAITARASARAEDQRQRIEDAICEHLRTAHSDQEHVRTLGECPLSSPPTAGHCTAPPSSPPDGGAVPCARRVVTAPEDRPGCPGCGHAVEEHEERAGHRVCTRGRERPSCRVCAEIRDQLPARPVPLDFAAMMRRPPSVLPMPLILGRPYRGVAARQATVRDVR